MHPYHLIGKTIRGRIAEQIIDAVMKWQEYWCIDIKQPFIDISTALERQIKSSGFGAQKDKSDTIFCFDENTNWKKILFGHTSNSCPNDSIATATINDAKKSFITSLLKHLNVTEVQDLKHDASQIKMLPRDGHVLVKIIINDEALEIWLSSKVVRTFIPAPSKYNTQTLVQRKNACEAAIAKVKAKLDLGNFPIMLLQNLKVGDVLSTDIKLDTPMHLEINKDTYLRAHLGQQNGHKALLFLSNNNGI